MLCVIYLLFVKKKDYHTFSHHPGKEFFTTLSLYSQLKRLTALRTYLYTKMNEYSKKAKHCSKHFFISRALLGQAMGVKRGSLMVMIREHDDFAELFQECKGEVEQLPTVVN